MNLIPKANFVFTYLLVSLAQNDLGSSVYFVYKCQKFLIKRYKQKWREFSYKDNKVPEEWHESINFSNMNEIYGRKY